MNAAQAIEVAARRTTHLLWAAAGMALVLWLVSGISTVEPGNRAVVVRWGAVDRVVDSGLLLSWPRPCERIIRIPGAERTQTTVLRRFASPKSAFGARAIAASMLTPSSSTREAPQMDQAGTPGCLSGDMGLVHLTATVVWTVEDPRAYVVSATDADATIVLAIDRAFASTAVACCARRNVDGILVVGSAQVDAHSAQERDQLRGELVIGLNDRLHALGIGISVQRVDLQVELPDDAKPAFAEVLSAAQGAERAVAQARTLAEREHQEAMQARSQRLAEASANAHETISSARVATDSIVTLAHEQDPRLRYLLRQRIYRDCLDTVLRQAGQVSVVTPSTPSAIWMMQLWSAGGRP
jgi:regulator of protease activity HflC (stomatin/prohibitin superfamily)